MVDIKINSNKDYSQEALLSDRSVKWPEDKDKSEILKLLQEKANASPITRLRHPEVRYEVTDNCNADCIMCPREIHKFGRPHGVMATDKFKASIDEVVELGCNQIVLTGFGEPLVDKQLELKIEYAKSKNLNTYIISNASLLTKKRAESIIKAGLDELRVSFYGMQTSTYNKVMVGLEFDVTMQNLDDFLELREQLGNKKPRLELNWLVLPENEGDTESFKEYWGPKADAIEIWKPHNFGDGRSYRERYDDVSMKTTCGRPENGPLQIQWNGEVIPCCYDYNNQIILGNAFQQPVLEILNNNKYNLLRNAHSEKNFGLFPFCNQCDQLLPHTDALIYTTRHNLPPEIAVKMSNTDLYNLVDDEAFDDKNLNPKYADGLVEEASSESDK